MRILIVNWSIRRIAGTEDYLNNLIPELRNQGHDLAFAHEVDLPANRQRIDLPAGTPRWDVSIMGRQPTLEAMKAWKPDIIYAHGMLESSFEASFVSFAPSIYFAHNYYGTCISGLKTFKFPVVRPCNRAFGAACLLHYFPRRCGGRNPITMFRLFRRESKRLANLAKYQAVVTHSNHMREEYIRNGLLKEQVHSFLYEIGPRAANPPHSSRMGQLDPGKRGDRPASLLFVGRMELLKGGGTLIDALPLVAERLQRPIRLVLAGEGPARRSWERQARRIRFANPSIDFDFAGWVDKASLEKRYAEAELLVVPSLWPEPFGRIGPEAGLRGVPVAAFQVGGVTDWLVDGENGFLAPGDPPTVAGIAEAIVKCLEDPVLYEELRTGALKIASRFNITFHLKALNKVFEEVQRRSLGPLGVPSQTRN